jgi:hypothetical protein
MPNFVDYDDETNDVEIERDNPNDVTYVGFDQFDFSVFSREYNSAPRHIYSR